MVCEKICSSFGKNIKLLDESYFMYVEDLDYSYRVWKSGYKLYHIPISKVWHKVGASSGEGEVPEFSVYWYHRNIIKFKNSMKFSLRKFIALMVHYLTRPIIYIKWLIKNPKIAKYIIFNTYFHRVY